MKGLGDVLAQEEGRAVEARGPTGGLTGSHGDVDFVLRVRKFLAGAGSRGGQQGLVPALEESSQLELGTNGIELGGQRRKKGADWDVAPR